MIQKGGAKSFSLKVIELPTIGLDRCRETFPSVNSSNICTLAGVDQGLCYVSIDFSLYNRAVSRNRKFYSKYT